MRTGGIARAGQAGSFRRCWFYRVKIGEQAPASRLPRNAHEGDEIIGGCAGDAALSHAPVAVSVESAPMIVHGAFVEIQQIAVVVAAALLPDTGPALNGIIWRGVDCHPRLPLVVGGGNERVPFARETAGLVIARLIGAYKATSGATGTSADGFRMCSILDSMRCTNIYIANPGLAAVRADFNVNVALGRIVRRHRLIVYITKIGGVIAINCDRRIGAVDLRPAAGDKKFIPCGAAISAQGTALRPSTALDWEPRSAIRRHVHVSVQPAALRSYAVVSQDAGTITGTQGIAALACCGPYHVLRAIINSLALIDFVSERAQRIRI